MRSAALTHLAVVAAALAAIVMAGAVSEREVAGSVGLPAVREAATLAPGEETCRRGIDVAAPFARVRIVTGTGGRPGPPLEIAAGTQARGRVAPGYVGGTVEARTGPVPAGTRIEMCVRNRGTIPVVLLGAPAGVLAGQLGDPALPAAPAVVLVRDRPVSTLRQVPAMVDRAARFNPAAPWLLWLLLVAAVLALPALLVTALRAAARG